MKPFIYLYETQEILIYRETPYKGMEIPKNSRTILSIAGVLLLVAAIYLIPVGLKAAEPAICTIGDQCQHEIFANQLITAIPIVLLIGMGIGAAAYYFFSEKRQAAPKQVNLKAIYKLLDSDERKVFEKIIENKGKALQSEISYIEGIGKVRAHRIIDKMVEKGIIEKEAFGKTNSVKLPKDLAELFF